MRRVSYSLLIFLDKKYRTLESILGFVEEQVGRKKAVRVLYSMADAGKIQEYRERLAAGMNKFEVRQVIFVLYRVQSGCCRSLTR